MTVNFKGRTGLKERARTYLVEANTAFRLGNRELAIDLYNKAKIENPELSDLIGFNIYLAEGENADSFRGMTQYVHRESMYALHSDSATVNIVIPVYNALDDVKRCLAAIERNTDGFNVTTIIVNDGSDIQTTEWLREFCRLRSSFLLTENSKNLGYTPTVNVGLKQCDADYIVTLNSDTIVTKGWLQGMVRCFKSDRSIGVVGPLSNAASWQNVPDLVDNSNQFSVNELPEYWSPDDMALLVRRVSKSSYPRVPFVNGFCFMISRETFKAVGLLDEQTFPTGYGEENDYCMRVSDAGFSLAICDDSYVFHAKSKSFGHDKRKKLSKIGSDALKKKHGTEKINDLSKKIREMAALGSIRSQVKSALQETLNKEVGNPLLKRILFLLPVSGGGGGVHSIVQETMGMRRLGVRAKIAVPQRHRPKFIEKYTDIDIVEDLFVGFEAEDLVELSRKYDVVVGTIYTSMKLVKKIKEGNPGIQAAYYIQDYEPFFSDPDTAAWQEARDSYTLVPNAILFAKTHWICNKVYEEHGVQVHKVSPSIDHEVYKPDPLAKIRAGLEDKIVVSAMIRPKTPRRGAERTMAFLKSLHGELGTKLSIQIFGCESDDPLFLGLERNFLYRNHGELTRTGVARVLQLSDFFIDLSDYQAFGRTGLEAMACGAFAILTKFGGVYEYAEDGINSLIVDPFDVSVHEEVLKILSDESLVSKMKINALRTAARFNIHKASISELYCLSRL